MLFLGQLGDRSLKVLDTKSVIALNTLDIKGAIALDKIWYSNCDRF
ncbi:hypothetical protein H6G76_31965 [Nostoc sp. FACHB-152]|nr:MULTISPECIES: hypothetical protein [unclassified Nostoc]MBD2451654.1 hypothetical protein [Nostoc sp. FACHB-152]MBD2472762.1 hypothetical protein [Nostoc sp. FACHB-145]